MRQIKHLTQNLTAGEDSTNFLQKTNLNFVNYVKDKIQKPKIYESKNSKDRRYIINSKFNDDDNNIPIEQVGESK